MASLDLEGCVMDAADLDAESRDEDQAYSGQSDEESSR